MRREVRLTGQCLYSLGGTEEFAGGGAWNQAPLKCAALLHPTILFDAGADLVNALREIISTEVPAYRVAVSSAFHQAPQEGRPEWSTDVLDMLYDLIE